MNKTDTHHAGRDFDKRHRLTACHVHMMVVRLVQWNRNFVQMMRFRSMPSNMVWRETVLIFPSIMLHWRSTTTVPPNPGNSRSLPIPAWFEIFTSPWNQ